MTNRLTFKMTLLVSSLVSLFLPLNSYAHQICENPPFYPCADKVAQQAGQTDYTGLNLGDCYVQYKRCWYDGHKNAHENPGHPGKNKYPDKKYHPDEKYIGHRAQHQAKSLSQLRAGGY